MASFECARQWWLLAILLASAAGRLTVAQESSAPAQSTADREKVKRLDFFRDRISALKLAAVDRRDEPFELLTEPLITFENPVSQMWDGLMFAWTDRGRPAAVLKCYYHSINKRWGRTFVSLSPGRIEMVGGDKQLWTPADGGLSFAPLPDAAKPAGDERRRLTQMRDFARRFTMVDRWGLKDPTDYQLRLLPTPLLRYKTPDDVIDGAMFGYVVNSPEALVLVEARKTAEGLAWHYAVARFTRFAVTVSLDGKQIAEFPRLEAWPPTGVYFHDPVEMPDYPFARKEKTEP